MNNNKNTNSQEEKDTGLKGEEKTEEKAELKAEENPEKPLEQQDKEQKLLEAEKSNNVTDKVVSRETELIEKLAEMQDKYLRLAAEFDNYRKRTLKEKIELSKQAGEKLLLGLLPVMDDFERALDNLEVAPECSSFKEGVELIYIKFKDFLSKQGIKEIESLHCEFNVDLHDAVKKIPVEDESLKGKIIEVLQKGYYLNNKVIRHSKVVVGE
ncbi:MAG TPA: nucleotide exchange factor GrpE [Bacteroidales bacterium]|nr:nucleotide exchange factor GrpE [Bacteroidales bacterium]HOU96053.1 nucleotide exchange factor GrpE [Bacteroidales bacterium]HQG36453.1 nucleotide exchange factor GrpE [Bacteroidales bacterium]HQG52532.1 nucleotide exchange factor GrpE [Bacteroidales bacterium]HQJ20754.1 nucleotide exchange factor GrpE [Bacteroidales bacterium]